MDFDGEESVALNLSGLALSKVVLLTYNEESLYRKTGARGNDKKCLQ
jgi:hypothetical protein